MVAKIGKAHGHDRRADYEWLRVNGDRFRGRWVALDGGTLVASAATLRELSAAGTLVLANER